MRQTLYEAKTYRVVFLSPVHVGTEEQLGPHDLLYQNGRVRRVLPSPLLEALQGFRQEMDAYIRTGLPGIAGWLERQPALLDRITLYVSPVVREPRWMREPVRPFLADPLHRPYLPGTELKGAIRTALLWHLVKAAPHQADLARSIVREADKKKAGSEVARLLGQDPNHDLLRVLRVADTGPVRSQALRLVPVVIAARSRDGLRVLQSPRGRDRPSRYAADLAQALAAFCECLMPGSDGLRVTVGLDRFLAAGSVERGGRSRVPGVLGWQDPVLSVVGRWPEVCNAFARHVAEGELRWWQQARSSAPAPLLPLAAAVEAFYAGLLRRLQEAREGRVYLNLGWGGGWRTKTVTEAFGEAEVRRVVQRYQLDRGANSRPFPKTRKVALVSSADFAPPGWVELVPE